MASKIRPDYKKGYCIVDKSTSIWKYPSIVYIGSANHGPDLVYGQTGSASYDTLNKCWMFEPHDVDNKKVFYFVEKSDLYFGTASKISIKKK